MAGRVATGIRRLWPRTGRAWAFAVTGVLTFFVLDVLALWGSDLALDLLIFLSGMLAGWVLARLVTLPFRKRFGPGVRETIGTFLGFASIFVIVFAGTALAGIPAYPTAEGGNIGVLIYGFAFGFGISVPGGLGLSQKLVPRELSGPRHPELKVVGIVLATVAALFASLFVLFLLIEYALVPLIRTLAT